MTGHPPRAHRAVAVFVYVNRDRSRRARAPASARSPTGHDRAALRPDLDLGRISAGHGAPDQVGELHGWVRWAPCDAPSITTSSPVRHLRGERPRRLLVVRPRLAAVAGHHGHGKGRRRRRAPGAAGAATGARRPAPVPRLGAAPCVRSGSASHTLVSDDAAHERARRRPPRRRTRPAPRRPRCSTATTSATASAPRRRRPPSARSGWRLAKVSATTPPRLWPTTMAGSSPTTEARSSTWSSNDSEPDPRPATCRSRAGRSGAP